MRHPTGYPTVVQDRCVPSHKGLMMPTTALLNDMQERCMTKLTPLTNYN